MVQEIKLKVNMHCGKCRTKVLKTVAGLTGVDEVSVDLENEMLVVIGDVDPVCVATCLRKKGKIAKIVTVGPYKKKDKDVDKPNKPTPATIVYSNAPCQGYQHVVVGYPSSNNSGICNIL